MTIEKLAVLRIGKGTKGETEWCRLTQREAMNRRNIDVEVTEEKLTRTITELRHILSPPELLLILFVGYLA